MKTKTSNKKRILIFSIAYYPFVGGAEVAVREITKRLTNYEFTLITLRMDRKLPKREVIDNIEIHRIGFLSSSKLKLSVNWPLLLSKYLFPFQALLKARSLQRKGGFCASWSIMANYAGFAALFFKWTNSQIPFLLTLQEGDSPEHIRKRVGLFMPLYKRIFRKADKVQAISNFLADYAREMGYRGEVSVVPNGVDIEKFAKEFAEEERSEALETVGKKEGDIILITTSRLVKKNAVDDIIRSLSYLPGKYKLYIAGQGSEEDNLRSLTKELDLGNRVIFGGFVLHENLHGLLKVSDIFVRPSRSEGLGNSFLEAMAVGLPVIATSVGGIVDFLENEKTGFFCEVDNPKSIAEQVKKISENPILNRKIVSNSRKMVSEKYSWNLLARRVGNIFEELCSS